MIATRTRGNDDVLGLHNVVSGQAIVTMPSRFIPARAAVIRSKRGPEVIKATPGYWLCSRVHLQEQSAYRQQQVPVVGTMQNFLARAAASGPLLRKSKMPWLTVFERCGGANALKTSRGCAASSATVLKTILNGCCYAELRVKWHS
ncbi:unnamed protein product [Cercospora beticola]|nr:unnamed protein product [Cercospora beticola]